MNQTLTYASVAHLFDEATAVLRDIYVMQTSIADWDLLIRALCNSQWQSKILLGDVEVHDISAEQVFADRSPDDDTYSIRLTVGNFYVWSHFYEREEIEFSFRTAEIDSDPMVEALLDFMRWLSVTLSKDVKLTIEAPGGERAEPLLLWTPNARSAEIFTL